MARPEAEMDSDQFLNRQQSVELNFASDVNQTSGDRSDYAVTIRRPKNEVFRFFRNFENLPAFMKDIQSVTVTSPKRSHWIVKPKVGPQLEWDAEILAEQEGQMISWRSVEGSDVETSGTIRFRDLNSKGTVVSLDMDYKIPGGRFAELTSLLTGDNPDLLALTNLRRLKALLETGEVPTIEGQPSGREEGAETIHH